ncbi:MAG TPA: hypothetical protein GX686_10440 [Paracoccus sp.]|nr:hypothetical protein [Paracoccus sp. (in: a-proteobacteria)]
MHMLPRTRTGRAAVWMLLPVLAYPLYWSVVMAIPDSMRWLSIAVGAAIMALGIAALLTAGVALVRDRDRSWLLIAITVLTVAMVAFFAVGEILGGR